MATKGDKGGWFAAVAAAYFVGGAVQQRRSARLRLSRAEQEVPNLVDEVEVAVLEALEQVVYDIRESEDSYRDEMADDLADLTGLQVEVAPASAFGMPDLLVEGVLAIEIKRGLRKAARDRAVGQCADYSRRWRTLLVIFDTPPSQVQRLEDLLEDKGLDHIGVISFAPSDVDED